MRQRILPPRTPVVPQVSETESSPASPASPTYAPEVTVPKAPVHADVIPDVVTHADLPQSEAPSPVSLTPVLVRMEHLQVPLLLKDSAAPGLVDLDSEDVEPADMGMENTLQKAQP